MVKVIKTICLFLLSFSLIGCNVKENVRLQVYETDYKGIATSNYPIKVFTDTKILKLMDEYATDTTYDVEKKQVLYLIKFYDEEDVLNTLILNNNGQISQMKIGLKFGESFVSEEGMLKIVEKIQEWKK